jgi:galactose mutarotase-like enzyme
VIELEGGRGSSLVVDPDNGGRIVSLRAHDREWLSPSTPDASGGFGHPGMGGWDEALPTIGPATVDGVALGDHGDVWNRAWDVASATGDSVDHPIDLSAELTVLPLRFRRVITATVTGFRLDYRVTTRMPHAVPFLWSAHPLFSAPPGTALRVDASGTVAPGGTRFFVEEYPSRATLVPAFFSRAIDSIERGRSQKSFAEGVCAASVVHSDGAAISLSWDAAVVPAVGLFLDRGEFAAAPVVAIEPTSAATDSLDRDPTPWTVTASRPRSWSIDLAVELREHRLPLRA